MKFVSAVAAVCVSIILLVGCKAADAPVSPLPTSSTPIAPTGSTTPPPAPPPSHAPATRPVAVSAAATTSGTDVIATIEDIPITRAQLEKPLIQAHGLNFLAKVAQLELAKKEAEKRGITVTAADVAAETNRYLAGLFNEERDPMLRQMNNDIERAEAAKDTAKVAQLRQDLQRERYRLLDQLLEQQKLTRPDFELVMQTNTYLRRIGTALVQKEKITDENLQTAFNAMYGEKVQVRHIALANRQEAMEAQRRLAAGEPFDKVARELSRNQQSAALGGELPPFTRNNETYPQQFRDVAFGLTEGQVSDVVVAANGYHLIKLDKRIAPKVVKFDDVKESVREELYNRQLEAFIRELSNSLKRQSAVALKINEPELKRQFDQQVNRREDDVKDRDEVRRDLERRRPKPETQESGSSLEPATAPSESPGTRPATGPSSH